MRVTKNAIQGSMEESGLNTVMSNRLSWRKFDKMRKDEALQSSITTPNRRHLESVANQSIPPAKRKHGSRLNLTASEEDLLDFGKTKL